MAREKSIVQSALLASFFRRRLSFQILKFISQEYIYMIYSICSESKFQMFGEHFLYILYGCDKNRNPKTTTFKINRFKTPRLRGRN
jgi:hypothetical protein